MSDEEVAARAEVRLPPPFASLERVRALWAVGGVATATGHQQALSPRAARWQAVKNEGNELFKEAHFADALDKYNQAIDLNPEVPTYYCNRTFRTGEYDAGTAPAAAARGPRSLRPRSHGLRRSSLGPSSLGPSWTSPRPRLTTAPA